MNDNKETEEWIAKLPEGDQEMVRRDMTEHCDAGDHMVGDVRSCFVCGFSACFGHLPELMDHMQRLRKAEQGWPMAQRFKKMWLKLKERLEDTYKDTDWVDSMIEDIEDQMLYDGIPRAVNLEEDLKRLEEDGFVNIDGESFSLTEKGIHVMKQLADDLPPVYLECAKAARQKVEQEEEEWYRELNRYS